MSWSVQEILSSFALDNVSVLNNLRASEKWLQWEKHIFLLKAQAVFQRVMARPEEMSSTETQELTGSSWNTGSGCTYLNKHLGKGL